MKRLLLISLVCVLLPVQANAEPSKAVQYLMNDCFSMFDYGLHKMEEHLMDYNSFYKIEDCSPSTILQYDYDRNWIIISLVYIIHQGDKANKWDKLEIEKIAEQKINGIKGSMKLAILSGKYFTHFDYQKVNTPENLIDDIIYTIRIATTIIYPDKSKKVSFTKFTEDTIEWTESDNNWNGYKNDKIVE